MIKTDFDLILSAAETKYAEFMDVVCPGWKEDANSVDTPKRVAKMFLQELFQGLHLPAPKVTVFENTGNYDGLVFQGNIEVKSMCAHHHMPFFGVAHVAYIPLKGKKIVGLSKLNRMVNYFARRPQVQENLTKEIHDYVSALIGDNRGVAVVIKAKHLCIFMRGVNQNTMTQTAELSGAFLENENLARLEFFDYIKTVNHQ